MSELVSLENATKAFGKEVVLDGVNLKISSGELVVVLGENGAGKTTLLRLMAGLLGLNKGLLKIEGEKLDRFSEKQREKIFFLPDFPVLFEEATVLENIEIWMSLYGCAEHGREDEAIRLVEEFRLGEKLHQFPGTLSRGQRFKLALICYDLVEARIGLIDEPFASGMDASGLRRMRRLLVDATESGRAVVYSTQLVKYACEFSSRIIVIDGSSIYFDGTSSEFFGRQAAGDLVLQKYADEEL